MLLLVDWAYRIRKGFMRAVQNSTADPHATSCGEETPSLRETRIHIFVGLFRVEMTADVVTPLCLELER